MIAGDDALISRAEQIFDAIVDLPSSERTAALDERCGPDVELRAFVEHLLRIDESDSADEIDRRLRLPPPMHRSPPFRVGQFEVLRTLGHGGMGVVYLARDTRLGRDVAIKALPESLASDPDRLARFQREAMVLASLSHSNIAAIYGIEEVDERHYLVLEYVEGETLAHRLAHNVPTVDEAIEIAMQIASALEAAHERGVIHRDLKPGNILITPDGHVTVLDFGLARMTETSASTILPPPNESPTPISPAQSRRPTMSGDVVGTPGYMSPEQARGKSVDRRSDIFSFGCVLYEMLTGVAPFCRDSVADTLAATLHSDVDEQLLPSGTPPGVRRLLRRCLAKDRKKRLCAVGDARLELELAEAESDAPVAISPKRTYIAVTGAFAIIILLVAGIASIALRSSPTQAVVTRALLDVTPAERLRSHLGDDGLPEGRPSRTAFAISPDGRSLVFSAVREGQQQLYLRGLDRLQAIPLNGTEGGSTPFFSPNGRWIGFWANRALRRVSISGGPPVTIAETPRIMSATWTDDDRIVFSRTTGGLWQVPASGGQPEPLTTLNTNEREISHRFAQVLPGNRAVLFTVVHDLVPNWDEAHVVVKSLATGERTVLMEGGADARYVSTGHILYVRHGALIAVPFDLRRLEVTGSPVGVIADLMQASNMGYAAYDSGAGQYSVSASGSLVYVAGGIKPDREFALVWVDRAGNIEPLPMPHGYYIGPRLSPDAQRIAVAIYGARHADRNVWLYDRGRNTFSPLTRAGDIGAPVWTPDGERIVFPAEGAWSGNLFWTAADGDGTPERLTTSVYSQMPTSVSPDGTTLAFVQHGNVWVLPLADDPTLDSQPQPILNSGSYEAFPEFSPDGRWLAFASEESGRSEVYIQPWPGQGPKQQVSVGGGQAPAWRGDGRELFYHSEHGAPPPPSKPVKMMAVSITTEPDLKVGKPKVLFEGSFFPTAPIRSYDVTPDGERFLMVQTDTGPLTEVREVIYVKNWFAELTQRVPVRVR